MIFCEDYCRQFKENFFIDLNCVLIFLSSSIYWRLLTIQMQYTTHASQVFWQCQLSFALKLEMIFSTDPSHYRACESKAPLKSPENHTQPPTWAQNFSAINTLILLCCEVLYTTTYYMCSTFQLYEPDTSQHSLLSVFQSWTNKCGANCDSLPKSLGWI